MVRSKHQASEKKKLAMDEGQHSNRAQDQQHSDGKKEPRGYVIWKLGQKQKKKPPKGYPSIEIELAGP